MKKKKIIIISIILLLFAAGFAYASYVQIIKGNGFAQIAKPILEIEVQDANSENNYHSYYNVIVKNYNTDNKISEVTFDYTIDVVSTDGSSLPEYTWYDSAGNDIGTELSGTLMHTNKQEQTYTICFKNTGTNDVIKNIKFVTSAEQKK